MNNPIEVIKVATPQIGEEEIAAVREVLLSGRFVSGPKVAEFERLFAEYIGVEHCVAVNSGTAAIQAALDAVGVGPGDEVIVPALTFFSTATAVMHQNAIPVFADISLDNFCMDPIDFESRITPRTRAVIPVHYFGHAAEMDAINQIAGKHGLIVIEDCAQAHGTKYKDQVVGSIGEFGAFSFFATKHMTTGEGGAITTNNAEWAKRMKMFRSHGMSGRDDHVILGYNYRMTEIAGVMGSVQLGRLDGFNENRVKNSEYLIKHLVDIPWMTLPKVPAHVYHTYFWLHVVVDEELLGFNTQVLIEMLRHHGIEVRHRYLEPLNHQPLLRPDNAAYARIFPPSSPQAAHAIAYDKVVLPNAEKVAGRLIGLPNRPDMTQAEMERVIEVMHSIR